MITSYRGKYFMSKVARALETLVKMMINIHKNQWHH